MQSGYQELPENKYKAWQSGRLAHYHRERVVAMLALLLIFILVSISANAEPGGAFRSHLTSELLGELFPGAEGYGSVEGKVPAVPVFMEQELEGFRTTAGYIFSVKDILSTRGYTGEPFDILVGINLDGFVTGSVLVEHREPVFRNTGQKGTLDRVIAGLVGLDTLAVPFQVPQNYASLGDASALILLEGVYRAGREVAISRELRGPGERVGRRLNTIKFKKLDWKALRETGLVRHLSLATKNIESLLGGVGTDKSTSSVLMNAYFDEIYTALATPPIIGQNLLGPDAYENLLASGGPGSQYIFLAMNGIVPADLKVGAGSATGTNPLSSLSLRQDGTVLLMQDLIIYGMNGVTAAGVPVLSWIAVIEIPSDTGFDETRPWALEFRVGINNAQTIFGLPYTLPTDFVVEPVHHSVAVSDNQKLQVPPLWISVWMDQKLTIGILLVSLLLLTSIMIFQGKLARHAIVLQRLRAGFLVFTLIWMGWYACAQLSVMHLISFIQAPFREWSLSSLLLDPLTVILLAFVAASLLLLGRGVFCGWLCPFGALQELVSQVAKRMGVRQIRIPSTLNERLWALKYVILILLIGIAFFDPSRLVAAVEVEPFNTAILYGFARSWPYTVFAFLVLGIGLFVERFFCRYICPLGAGLAIIGRWRMLDWFKRHPECGSSCHICQDLCPVQAIGGDGAINMNECYHCLSCQVVFYDDQVCPPLVSRRDRRSRILKDETLLRGVP